MREPLGGPRSEPQRSGVPAPAPVPESPAYRGYVLGVLFLVMAFNILDRQILAVLMESIKRDLALSDSQLGFLGGFAFALFYTAMGIPVARWADRSVRRSVVALALLGWSAMTAVSGLAQGFWSLFLARVGVGIGEAGGSPPSHSMVSDIFPPERRASALGIVSAGGSVGVFLGLFAGGLLHDLVGWRLTLALAGAAGVALALLVRMTVREPLRGRFDPPDVSREQEPLGVVLRFMLSLRSYRHLVLAASLHSFAGYGASLWTPSFLIRVHGYTTTDVAHTLAPIFGAASLVGILASGFVVDRLARRDVRWNMWLPALAAVVALPSFCGFLLAPSAGLAFVLMLPSSVLGAVYAAPTHAMTQGLAKPAMRALASALTLFVLNLVGFGLGPWAVGILNDALAPRFGPEAVRYSLLLVAVAHLWAAGHSWAAARTLREDLRAKELR